MNNPAGPSIAEIKAALQTRVRDLVHHLAPGGQEKGGIYKPLNPTRADRSPGSFCIWTTSGTAGAWKDYATGEFGDIIDLVGYCLGYGYKHTLDRAKTLQWSKVWTGLDRGALPAEQRVQRPSNVVPVDEAARRARLAKQSRAMWLKGGPSLKNTLAETYLNTRGLPIGDLKNAPGALRFSPLLEYVDDRGTRFFPAILGCMVRDYDIVAVHRTYLATDGLGKAPVTPSRKVFGDARGAIIPIARGQSDLPLREANENGIADTLVLTEGVEDALAVALSEPAARVWAAYSLGNLAAIKLPPCAHEVIIFADNDWAKQQAQQQLERAVEALSSQLPFRDVRVARAAIGKDANDLLNAGG